MTFDNKAADHVLTTDREFMDALRNDLRAADYSGSTVTAILDSAEHSVRRSQRVPAQRRLDARRASGERANADVLIELFIVGNALPAHEVAAVFSRLGIENAVRHGLLSQARPTEDSLEGSLVSAAVDLVPFSWTDAHGTVDWLIASDHGELSRRGPLPDDFVLGVGGATRTLAGLMLPRPVESLLDIGTGCGVLAMLASRYVQRVVATDLSHRALAFAAFNIALNLPDADNIELRHGSLFDPVAGELFDRIVSNPPFVITPRSADVPSYEYRDGGMVGDGLIRAVATGVARHLRDDGVAQLLGNWEYLLGEDNLRQVEQWFLDEGCSAWAIERERQSCDLYAETWIRDGGHLPHTQEFDRLYNSWVRDFEEREVVSIGFGYLVVRPAPGEIRMETVSGALGENALGLGVAIQASLEAASAIEKLSEEDVCALKLITATDVTEHRHYLPGEDDPAIIQLIQGGGFGRTINADTALAACVGACDGELSVGAIASALADLLDANPYELRRVLVSRLRELVRDGFLHIAFTG